MARPLLIQGGRIVDPAAGVDAVGDLLLAGGRVAWSSLERRPPPLPVEMCEMREAVGLIVAPGFVDLHAHLREPGYESKETIGTGTRAAAAGGFTTVCCMPNTNPVMDDKSVVELVLKIAVQQGVVRVLPIGAISKGSEGLALAAMAEMADAGVVGFSDDGQPAWHAGVTRHAMEYSLALGLPIIDHCQDLALTKGSSMHEGEVSAQLGLKGWPSAAEEMMVARDIQLSRLTGARVHIAHISTAGAVGLVRQAKAEGLPVTAEVTPHHLTLTDERVLGPGHGLIGLEGERAERPFETAAKVNPPLRTAADVEAVTAALKDGTIDCIATDHAPHAYEDKLCEFDMAANGISGFETAFGVALSLVHRGMMDISFLIGKMTWEPARLLLATRQPLVPLGLGTLALEAAADVVLVDPEAEWVVEPREFRSKGKNSPYGGVRMKGRVVATYSSGVLVYERD